MSSKTSEIKLTQTEFLKQLYTKDPLISNQDAFKLLKEKFPKTKTTKRLLTSSWKYLIRKQGVKIPYQRNLKKQQ